MDCIKKEIAPGAELLCVNADRFKTNEIALSLALPLKKETAAANALMIGLLSRSSAECPNLLGLNKKLASLYGATLAASVSKAGESQVLKLGITCIDDRFSLDGGSISLSAAELLLSMLFKPRFDENGNFYQSDIDSEKRILTEKLEAEENEKRTYVLRRTESLMFENEPYSINRYGTKEDIAALEQRDIKAAWENALTHSKILVTLVGSADADKAYSLIKNAFSNIKRDYRPLPETVFVPACGSVKERTERMDVKQGKLVLGFRVNMKPDDPETPAMRSFCDIFGGGPYSKLFANVREKLSLCYYCSARYTRLKSMITVQCGCNEENMDKAVSEILNQLDAIKNGDFEAEFASSKIGLSDMIKSVGDAPDMIETWFASQIADNEFKTPEQSAAENDAVTKEQVRKCAGLLTLDTVYRLAAPKEDK